MHRSLWPLLPLIPHPYSLLRDLLYQQKWCRRRFSLFFFPFFLFSARMYVRLLSMCVRVCVLCMYVWKASYK